MTSIEAKQVADRVCQDKLPIDDVFESIKRAAERGEFICGFGFCLATETTDKLIELGYNVTILEDEILISWYDKEELNKLFHGGKGIY